VILVSLVRIPSQQQHPILESLVSLSRRLLLYHVVTPSRSRIIIPLPFVIHSFHTICRPGRSPDSFDPQLRRTASSQHVFRQIKSLTGVVSPNRFTSSFSQTGDIFGLTRPSFNPDSEVYVNRPTACSTSLFIFRHFRDTSQGQAGHQPRRALSYTAPVA
jgi:hypothetical protein